MLRWARFLKVKPIGRMRVWLVNLAGLLDHLVGAGEDGWRQLDAHRFGDAEVDPEIELGRTFEGQVAWLCAFQNAIKLRDQVTRSVGKIRPVRHEAAIG